MSNCYIDHKGRALVVAEGLGGGVWMTVWRSKYRGNHRVVSKYLPVRTSKEEAENDLAAYALDKRWTPCQVDHMR